MKHSLKPSFELPIAIVFLVGPALAWFFLTKWNIPSTATRPPLGFTLGPFYYVLYIVIVAGLWATVAWVFHRRSPAMVLRIFTLSSIGGLFTIMLALTLGFAQLPLFFAATLPEPVPVLERTAFARAAAHAYGQPVVAWDDQGQPATDYMVRRTLRFDQYGIPPTDDEVERRLAHENYARYIEAAGVPADVAHLHRWHLPWEEYGLPFRCFRYRFYSSWPRPGFSGITHWFPQFLLHLVIIPIPFMANTAIFALAIVALIRAARRIRCWYRPPQSRQRDKPRWKIGLSELRFAGMKVMISREQTRTEGAAAYRRKPIAETDALPLKYLRLTTILVILALPALVWMVIAWNTPEQFVGPRSDPMAAPLRYLLYVGLVTAVWLIFAFLLPRHSRLSVTGTCALVSAGGLLTLVGALAIAFVPFPQFLPGRSTVTYWEPTPVLDRESFKQAAAHVYRRPAAFLFKDHATEAAYVMRHQWNFDEYGVMRDRQAVSRSWRWAWEEYGFPFRCFRSRYHFDEWSRVRQDEAVELMPAILLYLAIMPVPFMANTALYAFAIVLLIKVPGSIRRWQYWSQGKCLQCVYLVGTLSRCPECGTENQLNDALAQLNIGKFRIMLARDLPNLNDDTNRLTAGGGDS